MKPFENVYKGEVVDRTAAISERLKEDWIMTIIRVYPEKNSVTVITEADETTDRLFEALADAQKETDGEYTYYRMKLDAFMKNLWESLE